ncbi:adenine-specific DNA-methyltransferase [Marmoricola sp. OAE513]|uniref:Eco57I restriction-modification methylase domain-containing protein n=1 Tax=Marmoricola sp. OAE513 TaxID=2817894 RepID=UPI001AE16783
MTLHAARALASALDTLVAKSDQLGGVAAVEGALIRRFCTLNACLPRNNKLILAKIAGSTPEADAAVSKIQLRTIDTLVLAFEKLASGDVKETGSVFTPQSVADFMAAEAITPARGRATVVDPSCGCGALLVAALRRLHALTGRRASRIIAEQLYGSDIDAGSIERVKVLLSLVALELGDDTKVISFNLVCRDSILDDFETFFPAARTFDVVIGNPPYVRFQKLGDYERTSIARSYVTASKGNFNLYFAFFELAAQLRAPGGAIAYITPSNYLRASSAAPLRMAMSLNQMATKIVDFGHAAVFPTAATYTAITIGDLAEPAGQTAYQECPAGAAGLRRLPKAAALYDVRTYGSNPWPLVSHRHQRNIRRLETSGPALETLASVRFGAATLRDNLFLLNPADDLGGEWLREHEGKRYTVEEVATRRAVRVSSVTNQADMNRYAGRIIYPYDIIDGRAVIWSTERLAEFPKCARYLAAIKDELARRDKGNKTYPQWYAYGRTQGLAPTGPKLLTPLYGARPRFLLDADPERLFLNGCSIVSTDERVTTDLLSAVLNSGLLHYYIEQTSSPLSGAYYSYQKAAIAKFTIPDAVIAAAPTLIAATPAEQDRILEDLYKVKIPTQYRR